jgi:hypothetical protein
MSDFVFKVDIVAVVRVHAADENVARKVVPTVLGAPSAVEIRLANENNALSWNDAIVTNVDFLIKDGSIDLVEFGDLAAACAPAPASRPRRRRARK